MAMTIVDVLNIWNYMGVFSYVLPFLLIFAVVFAILQKSKVLGDNARAVNTIVAVAIGLLALQFDMVPVFFADLFPKMGVFLAVVLVVLIFLGFVGVNPDGNTKWVKFIGIGAAIIVVLWSMGDFIWFGGYSGNLLWWFSDYFWSLIVLLVIIVAIVAVGKS